MTSFEVSAPVDPRYEGRSMLHAARRVGAMWGILDEL